jgi:uncharacterized protein YndB with AHSA1/START domain
MKLLFKILGVLLLLVSGLYVFGYFLPKQIKVKHTRTINARPDLVFPLINNPTNWARWSPWSKTYDPSLIHLYGGPVSGVGARHNWYGDLAGNWQMVFTQSTEPDSLTYELKQSQESGTATGSFKLIATKTGTEVTWQHIKPLEDNPVALYKGAWQNYKLEQDFKTGLNNLQVLLQGTQHNTAKK